VAAAVVAAQAGGDSSTNSNAQSARLDRLESDVAEIKNLLLNLQRPQRDAGNLRGHHAASDV
jgi:hypothetical protein